jgi:hypothetical protein
MTIRLSQLRVTSEHDSTRFVAGNRAVEQSSASAGAAVSRLSHTIELQNGKVSQGGDVVARLSRQYVAGYRDAERFASAINQLNQGIETGKIGMQDADRILAGMHGKFGLTANGAELAAQGYVRLGQAVDGYNAKMQASIITQARMDQQAAVARQIAASNQDQYNRVLGVQAPKGGGARDSAAVFDAEFRRMEGVAEVRAQQIGAAFSSELNERLVQGTARAARDSAQVFQAEMDRLEQIARWRTEQIGANFASDLNGRFGIGRAITSARDSASVFAASGTGGAKLNSGQWQQMSYQANDVLTMMLLGAPMQQIAASQGGQIFQVLQQNEGGVKGSIAAIKDSAASAARSVASMLGPVGLVTTGLIAAGGAAALMYRAFRAESPSAEDSLARQVALVKELERGYGLAADKIKSMSFETSGMMSLRGRFSQDELALLARTEARSFLGGITAISAYDQRTGEMVNTLPSEVREFADAIEYLRKTAAAGIPEVDGYRKRITDRWMLEPNNDELTKQAKALLDSAAAMVEYSTAAKDFERVQRELRQNVDRASGLLRSSGSWASDDRASLQAWRFGVNRELGRNQARFDADVLGLSARSPAEQRAAAEARARANVSDDVRGALRRQEIEQAGLMAQLSAEHQLAEAQKERFRSYDATLAAQRHDLDLIGKTGVEAEALRMEFELLQQVREEAARNNVQVDEAEIARIREMTAEYRRGAELRAQMQLNNDLAFDLRQMGRSSLEQRVASQLRSAGLAEDLNSAEAAAIRFNERLRETVSVWEEIRGVGMDAIDKLVDSAGNGFRDIDDVAKSLASDLLKEFTTLAAKNPLKNAIYGTDLPTLKGVGGAGGFLSALFGGPSPASGLGHASALGTMTVSAATVLVNGMPVGGSFGGIGGSVARMFAPANANAPGGSVESQVWNFFAGKGLASHQIAGIMGNVRAESGFNPSAIGDSGKAFGLFQHWGNRGGGRDMLGDVHGQLSLAWRELQTTERRAFDALLKSGDVREATAAFGGFERPKGFSWADPEAMHNFTGRLRGAEQALEKFGGATGQTAFGLQSAAQGLTTFGGGVADLGQNIQNFMKSGTEGGGMFGLLNSLFGGGGGFLPSFGFMNSISPLATRFILGGGIGLFAKGGISDRPAIFGEAGPEAAVPLPDGRRIPVELRQSDRKDTASGPMVLMGQIGVTVDDDMRIQVAIREMGLQSAQAGASLATRQMAKGLPNVQGSYQKFGKAS